MTPGKKPFKRRVRNQLLRLPGGDRIVATLRVILLLDVEPGTGAPHPTPQQPKRRSEQPDKPSEQPKRLPSALSELAHVRRIQIMEKLTAHLDAAGVAQRSLASRNWALVAILDTQLEDFSRALRDFRPDENHPTMLWRGNATRFTRGKAIEDVATSEVTSAAAVAVGVPYRNLDYSIRREGAVEVVILEQRNGRLVARRGRAAKSDWTREFAGSGTNARTASHLKSASVDERVVDVVYTWVDSSDPTWAAQRATWSGESDEVIASGSNDERYADRDELRYSLRSLRMYAPFVRNIYIVTADQRPRWLNEVDGIRVVSHRDIFPDPSVLPTFNSHAIEACLHRIPGLAQHYLYLNDDFFLTAPVTFATFYTKSGQIKSHFSPTAIVAEDEPAPESSATDWASYNARKLIQDEFGLALEYKLKHIPYAMSKTMLNEMETAYPEVFARTRAAKFRSPTDYAIPSMLAHYYGVATRRAVEWPHVIGEYIYADIGQRDFSERMREVLKKQPTFLCLNASFHTDIGLDAQTKPLQRFLRRRFPVAAPWEKPES